MLCLASAVWLLLSPHEAFAEDGAGLGRKLWDNIMLWVNFGILVFFFVKYAKKPLMTYLRGVRKKIEENLASINAQMQHAKSLMAVETSKLEGIDQEIKETRERFLEMGRLEKEKIIESGRITAEKMIEDAQAYANYKLATARKEISDELVDMAISMVEDKLMKEVSQEDSDRLVVQFMTDLESSKEHLRKKIG
jgi:F-type H+-transporting ATPase subunit b